MKKKYSYKAGRQLGKTSAQVVGEELTRISKESDGLVPSVVVEESRPKAAVLHGHFEWHNGTAADAYRVHQARQIINCVYVTHELSPILQTQTQAFVNVRVHEDSGDDPFGNRGRAYLPAEEVATDPDLRKKHLQMLQMRLKNLRREHANFAELGRVWAAVDECCD